MSRTVSLCLGRCSPLGWQPPPVGSQLLSIVGAVAPVIILMYPVGLVMTTLRLAGERVWWWGPGWHDSVPTGDSLSPIPEVPCNHPYLRLGHVSSCPSPLYAHILEIYIPLQMHTSYKHNGKGLRIKTGWYRLEGCMNKPKRRNGCKKWPPQHSTLKRQHAKNSITPQQKTAGPVHAQQLRNSHTAPATFTP